MWGKRFQEIQRHIVVDSQGLPQTVVVTTANVTGREGALDALAGHQDNLRKWKCLLTDGGYTGDRFALLSKLLAQRHQWQTFTVIPERWVVERSLSWFEKCRRLWKNGERKLNTSVQVVNLAFLAVFLKKLWIGLRHYRHKTHKPLGILTSQQEGQSVNLRHRRATLWLVKYSPRGL